MIVWKDFLVLFFAKWTNDLYFFSQFGLKNRPPWMTHMCEWRTLSHSRSSCLRHFGGKEINKIFCLGNMLFQMVLFQLHISITEYRMVHFAHQCTNWNYSFLAIYILFACHGHVWTGQIRISLLSWLLGKFFWIFSFCKMYNWSLLFLHILTSRTDLLGWHTCLDGDHTAESVASGVWG